MQDFNKGTYPSVPRKNAPPKKKKSPVIRVAKKKTAKRKKG